MTTNHRPTFESRRARDPFFNGGSSIAHGGASQKQLKYRNSLATQDTSAHREKLEELKKELQDREDGDDRNAGTKQIEGTEAPESYSERRERVFEETKDLDASDSNEDNDDDDDDDESDSESDSDDELLRELAKLKQEKLQKEKEQQMKAELSKSIDSTPSAQQPIKKSWRQSVFKCTKAPQKTNGTEHINDLLKSQFYQRFMERHMK